MELEFAGFARAVKDAKEKRSTPTSIVIRALYELRGESLSSLQRSILRMHGELSATQLNNAFRAAARSGLIKMEPSGNDLMVRLTDTGKVVAEGYSSPTPH